MGQLDGGISWMEKVDLQEREGCEDRDEYS